MYHRQSGETKTSYETFKIYLDERDLTVVADLSGKPLSEIKRLFEKYHWADRVEFYEFEKALNNESVAQQDYKAMLDIQINLGKMLQAKGAKFIQESKTLDEKTGIAIKMVTSGVEIERSARKAKRNALRT